jgi:hypothetical protein
MRCAVSSLTAVDDPSNVIEIENDAGNDAASFGICLPPRPVLKIWNADDVDLDEGTANGEPMAAVKGGAAVATELSAIA